MLVPARRVLLQRAAKLCDLAIVSLTFIVSFAVSSGTFTWPSFAEVLLVRVKVLNFFVFAGYLLLCSTVFVLCGFYLSHRLSNWRRQLREMMIATTVITLIPIALPFQVALVTKDFAMVFGPLTFAALVLTRLTAYPLLYRIRGRGRNLRNLVIVGEGHEVVALADRIRRETHLGYRLLGIINTNERQRP